MENLSSFYQSKGQALPSVQQRQGVASQAGIQNYSGTAQQNTQLLNFLKTQQTPQAQQQNAVPVSSNIPANIIGTQQVQIPQAQPIQAQPVENIASTLIEQTKTEATPLQGTQENLISKILENQLGLQGEAQAQADANLQAGVNTKIAELNDLNSKILQKQAEVQQDDITLVSQMRAEETRDTLLPFAQMGQAKLAGDAQIVRALKNAEIGVLNAQAIGKQGDVQLARDTAKQAVELKFAPYKERIALYQSQLEAISPLLDREEKKQAREQDIKTKLALSKIDKLETFQSKALENAISNNAPQSVISKILNANSIEGITSVGGNYLVSRKEKLELQKLQNDLIKSNAEIKAISSDSPIQQKIDATVNLKSMISDLASSTGKKGAVGFGIQKFIPGFLKPGESQFLPGTKSAGYETTFNQLKDTLAFENISKLKGAMSDKDIAFLRNIGTKLSLGMSEEDFNKELSNLDTKMNEILVKNGVDVNTINSYSSYSNEDLLSLPQSEVSNNNFFNK